MSPRFAFAFSVAALIAAWPAQKSFAGGDSEEVYSRCGPVTYSAMECLDLARGYASGELSNKPACMTEIGGPDDEKLNNAWLTLQPNGADPDEFEALRARRLTRFQSALTTNTNLIETRLSFFRADFTDCWDTYEKLRGQDPNPKIRDKYIELLEELFRSL